MKKRSRSTGHLGYSKGFEYIIIPPGGMFEGLIYRADMADPILMGRMSAAKGTGFSKGFKPIWYRKSERYFCTADEFRKMIDNPMVLNLYNEQGGRYHERTIFKKMVVLQYVN
jgi:hypothetical protein